jgi:hypothetical protein
VKKAALILAGLFLVGLMGCGGDEAKKTDVPKAIDKAADTTKKAADAKAADVKDAAKDVGKAVEKAADKVAK